MDELQNIQNLIYVIRGQRVMFDSFSICRCPHPFARGRGYGRCKNTKLLGNNYPLGIKK